MTLILTALAAFLAQLFAEENLPEILTVVGFAMTICGLIALWRCWK